LTNLPEAGDPADLQGLRLGRTALGQQEITAKKVTLARPARNLLLIIDGRQLAGDWLALVRGATPQDLQQLVASGLVAPTGPAATASPTPAPDAPATAPAPLPASPAETAPGVQLATARMSLSEALQGQGYKVLYDRLTAEARPQLGLIKGYKLILDIERCNGPDEIRLLAERVVEQVRALHGNTKARALAQRLADPP
jgi:hypothetical protein